MSTSLPPTSQPTSLTSANPCFKQEQEQEQEQEARVAPTQEKHEEIMHKLVDDNEDEPLLAHGTDATFTDKVNVKVPLISTITTTLRPLTDQPAAAPPSLRPRKPFVNVRAGYLRALNAAKVPGHVLFKSRDMWRNPRIHRINCLEPHAEIRGYRTEQQALAHDFAPSELSANSPTLTGSLIQLLDGELGEGQEPQGWRFAFADSPKQTPTGFEAPDFSDDEWDSVPVPSDWAMLGYNCPIYTNITYPWKTAGQVLSTSIPAHKNPTGHYRKQFVLPPGWETAIRNENALVRLIFKGAGSGVQLFVDGLFVGYHQDSMTEAEYDITAAVCNGSFGENEQHKDKNSKHCLAVRVFQYTDGSYLEDQDHWWMAGIHRSVELRLVPRVTIEDIHVVTDINTGAISAENSAPVGNATAPAVLRVAVSLSVDSSVTSSTPIAVTARLQAPASADPPTASNVIAATVAAQYVSSSLLFSQNPALNCEPAQLKQTHVFESTFPLGSQTRSVQQKRHAAYWTARDLLASRRQAATAVIEISQDQAQLWSCERPVLYKLVVSATTQQGAEDDTVAECAQVGFRRVNIKSTSGELCVNGRAIKIFGVNRHEHDQYQGKVVTEAGMLQDITLLKSLNFNAVRACHYPNHKRWYELCDQFGLYVCDEANIEAHGFTQGAAMSLLQYDARYAGAFMSRIRALVLRSRNHSCIITWSLGNEAGMGTNMDRAAKWVRTIDPTRPVQYEGGSKSGGAPLILGDGLDPVSDIVCPMYHTPSQIAGYARDAKEKRPIILCEYSHAMGNSNGNLSLYYDLFMSKKPELQQCQGGYIWDWVDQGIAVPKQPIKDNQGKVQHPSASLIESNRQAFWMGGEFGFGDDFGPLSGTGDKQFCINGLVFPDRTPHPAVYECSYLQQPFMFKWDDRTGAGGGVLHVENRFTFSNGADYVLDLQLINESKSVLLQKTHRLPPSCMAGKSVEVSLLALSNAIAQAQSEGPLWLVVKAKFDRLQSDAATVLVTELMQGRVVSWESIPLSRDAGSKMSLPTTTEEGKEAVLIQTDNYIKVVTPKYSVLMNATTGQMLSLRTENDEELLAPSAIDETLTARNGKVQATNALRHHFYRAPSDNDEGGADAYLPTMFVGKQLLSFAGEWKATGLDDVVEHTTHVQVGGVGNDPKVIVTASQTSQRKKRILFKTETTYTFLVDRVVMDVSVSSTRALKNVRSLPRVGLEFRLDKALGINVEWQGCGPHESYVDRKTGARQGVYSSSVDEMHVPYMAPSHNGGRADVHWVKLMDESNSRGLHVSYKSRDAPAPDVILESNAPTNKQRNASYARPVTTDGAQLEVSMYSDTAMQTAEHQHELREHTYGDKEDTVFLRIDTAHMGVGGDNSWMPAVHPQFYVKPRDATWKYQVELVPVSK